MGKGTTKGIFLLILVTIGIVMFTFLYNYILLNQLDFVIVGNFVFPYAVANDDRVHPAVYTFSRPMSKDWILNIQNTLSYALRLDAKVVIKLQEPVPNQRFIEIIMYGDTTSNRFLAALNTSDTGYIKLYDKNGVD
jgi:hypothetical protein